MSYYIFSHSCMNKNIHIEMSKLNSVSWCTITVTTEETPPFIQDVRSGDG